MRHWRAKGRTVLGAAALCFGLFGCAAEHDETAHLSDELARARADAVVQQARATELEARLSRLEQQNAAARSTDEHKLLSRVDRLLDMNERLLAAREAQTPADAHAAPPAPAPPNGSAPADAQAANEEQQLRALVERMRGRPGSLRGGLTLEQENALRVLLRSERKLDSENPLLPAFY